MYPTCMRSLALMAIDAPSTGGVTAPVVQKHLNAPGTPMTLTHVSGWRTTQLSCSKFSPYLPTTMIVVYTRETVTPCAMIPPNP